MKPFRSLRLRITLLCALLLTLCCAALAVTSNLSAIQLADTITAVPLEPAQTVPSTVIDGQPALIAPAAPAIQQAQRIFHTQSLLATAAILAMGLLLIYLLVGHALAPLKALNAQIQRRTAKDLNQPLSILPAVFSEEPLHFPGRRNFPWGGPGQREDSFQPACIRSEVPGYPYSIRGCQRKAGWFSRLLRRLPGGRPGFPPCPRAGPGPRS